MYVDHRLGITSSQLRTQPERRLSPSAPVACPRIGGGGDAVPVLPARRLPGGRLPGSRRRSAHPSPPVLPGVRQAVQDRKSTRLNSSHSQISYAVFCLKKKKPPCS